MNLKGFNENYIMFFGSNFSIRKGDLQRFIKNLILTSSVGEAGSQMNRMNKDAFR